MERRRPAQRDDILPCLGDFHAANRQRYQLSLKEKGKREGERERRGGERVRKRQRERDRMEEMLKIGDGKLENRQ